MITLSCPWCELDEAIEFSLMHEREMAFDCPDCGISVRFVDEPEALLDLAA